MKISYSKLSSWTGDDISRIEDQIKVAQADYQRYLDEYNYAVKFLSSKYAEKERWPRVERAKSVVTTLIAQKESMLADISKTQAIDIVDTTVNRATDDSGTKMPWGTIGLAIGALIVIVIIIKLIR